MSTFFHRRGVSCDANYGDIWYSIAAGALIVEEAGGVVTDIDGNALAYGRKSSVLARNKVAKPIE